MNFQDKILAITRTIPKGKITTYKHIAHALHTRAYRLVGICLARNPQLVKTPCHRVINSDGRIGGYAGLPEKKKALLESEGIIIENGKIDLKKYLFLPKSI